MGQIIDRIMEREGHATDDPVDHGGRTAFGISERSHPEAWADGKVTEEEARAIYWRLYIHGPGIDQIQDRALQEQLADFGVTSGPSQAIKTLQKVLQIEPDGILGPLTLARIAALDPIFLGNRLAEARSEFYIGIVIRRPDQIKFLKGWVRRAMRFVRP